MLKPRYYFANDFRSFYEYFLAQPHTKQIFQKGDYLWKPGQPYDRISTALNPTQPLHMPHAAAAEALRIYNSMRALRRCMTGQPTAGRIRKSRKQIIPKGAWS